MKHVLSLVLVAVNALLVFVLVLMVTGCGWFSRESRHVAVDAIDCTTEPAQAAIDQYAPSVDALLELATDAAGGVDTAKVKDGAKGFLFDTGMCVLADAVSRALSRVTDPNAPKSSELAADPAALRATFAALAGGRTYKTAHGSL